MKSTFTKSPDQKDIDTLTKKINAETLEYGSAYPFAFFMHDKNDQMIAGANGFIIYGTVYTDQLWVDEKYRKQGLGRALMDQVHEYARSEGCKLATIQTMNFQDSTSFYKKLGYTKEFEREGYVNKSSCLFMRKIL